MRATPLVLALAKAMVLALCQCLPPLSMPWGHPASRLLDSQPVCFGMGHFNQVETIYNYTPKKKNDRKVNPIDIVILRCSVFWGTAIFSFALGLDVVIMISDFHQHDDWFVVSFRVLPGANHQRQIPSENSSCHLGSSWQKGLLEEILHHLGWLTPYN